MSLDFAVRAGYAQLLRAIRDVPAADAYDAEERTRPRYKAGGRAIDGPVRDGGFTTPAQRQANSAAYLRAAARLEAKRERWQGERARAAQGEAKRARRAVRRVVRRAA